MECLGRGFAFFFINARKLSFLPVPIASRQKEAVINVFKKFLDELLYLPIHLEPLIRWINSLVEQNVASQQVDVLRAIAEVYNKRFREWSQFFP